MPKRIFVERVEHENFVVTISGYPYAMKELKMMKSPTLILLSGLFDWSPFTGRNNGQTLIRRLMVG